jgi:hypothetical protein
MTSTDRDAPGTPPEERKCLECGEMLSAGTYHALADCFDVLKADLAEQVETNRLLWQERRELLTARKDADRLDGLQRFGLANLGDGLWDQDVARIESVGESDQDEEGVAVVIPKWTIQGPRTNWGCRLGEGATLRQAIDEALAWENAPNLNELDDSEPRAAETSDVR